METSLLGCYMKETVETSGLGCYMKETALKEEGRIPSHLGRQKGNRGVGSYWTKILNNIPMFYPEACINDWRQK